MISYAICTTPRTASEALRARLRDLGLGDPGEWVSDDNWYAWIEREELWSVRTVNDVFAIKLFWAHREREYFADFDEIMPGSPRWIYLFRKNISAQARSYLTALHSGDWFSVGHPYLDFPEHHVAITRDRIRRWNEDWQRWFSWKGIDPLTISMEEFLADQERVTESVKEHILA